MLFGLGAMFLMGLSYGNYEWKSHSAILTLIIGAILAAWLFVLQRIRREIMWRYRGRFSFVDFHISPTFKENGEVKKVKKLLRRIFVEISLSGQSIR